ncbi:MAG: amino acid ABC transporter [Rhodospirillales bacterium 70-18]|nr:amino acid ABC transporter permease [Rhodospirillales bacterium]OJY70409.1 MAG: amino acid ABC transporter [Rhodospirillales bacterium 70-18]
MTFDLGLILGSLPEVLAAAWVTIVMWLASAAMGAALGFVLALLRRYGGRAAAWPILGFVTVIRGTPFLIQLFLLYYSGPSIGIDLDPTGSGLLSLSIYASAYFCEIFTGGFAAIPRGHVEAAICVGLSRAQIVARILVPEMALLVLPACVNMTILMMKETAVLSIVTVPELTLVITAIGSRTFAFAEALFLLAIAYWVLTEATGRLGRFAEGALARYRLA